ncbi:UDP-2,3-diacylglucosamine diphosphatase [Novosphingobium lentum]|uniref:UDP-2,3-diacylglucosamine diphosphatase n=1 Tax=Novosphingobium lentum TaxID=145287 RepID=UPI0008343297|nr:UDP-2,3-diacylglucosamine diphosphatase [Novosphingobium lentum]
MRKALPTAAAAIPAIAAFTAASPTRGSIPAWLDLPEPRGFRPKRKYRTVFISDIHLGTRGCNAALLLDFLQSIECDTLFLVGDIVDGWRLRKGWFWPDAHNEVVRRILKMAHRGTRVVLVAGNHDEMLRPYAGMGFGGVELALEAIHETADGRRLLVTHGDGFDGVVLYARWLAFLGDKAYELLLRANVVFNAVRRRFKLPYWSLSSYMKKRVKNAVQFVCDFEEAVAHAARDRGVDGVVCGHIHCAEIREIGNVTYYNDGDWVESCTALVEDRDGALSILDWAAEKRKPAHADDVREAEPVATGPVREEQPA